MSVPAARRIVVGVDGSVESAAALRWACREASLRGAEVLAVHAREALCHPVASYAVCAPACLDDVDVDVMWRAVMPDHVPSVPVRTEVVDGLAARVLLQRCMGADMLVLGTASDMPGALRSAGPVIRACLRRSPCPVVVIGGGATDPPERREALASAGETQDPAKVPVGAGASAGGRASPRVAAASPARPVPAGVCG
jgi:nucleotide-binding universal stress UspA family protein